MAEVVDVIWVKRTPEFFCDKGWTDRSVICPSGKSHRVKPRSVPDQNDAEDEKGRPCQSYRICRMLLDAQQAKMIERQ